MARKSVSKFKRSGVKPMDREKKKAFAVQFFGENQQMATRR